MLIETESTPNPQTLKFLPGRPVLGTGVRNFTSPEEAKNISPLAESLFSIPGVAGVLLGGDFLAVTKTAEEDWPGLQTLVTGALIDYFVAGYPVLLEEAHEETPPVSGDEDDPIAQKIRDLLETRVRPAVALDGGDIVFDRFDSEDGVVYLMMRGACSGCPSSTMTLKMGIENMLKYYVPEVTRVEAVL